MGVVMVIGLICLIIGIFFIIRGFILLYRNIQSSKTNKEKVKNIFSFIFDLLTGWLAAYGVRGVGSIYIGLAFIVFGIIFIV